MADDLKTQIYSALREGQSKYTYFLLAAAGAAIGLAIHQTQGEAICWTQIPLGLALVSWSLSFYRGCNYINHLHSAYYQNFMLLKGQEMSDLMKSTSVSNKIDEIKISIGDTENSAEKSSTWQFRWLILGAVCFIFWHILEMYMRSPL